MTALYDDVGTARIHAYDVLDAPPRRELVAVAELAARICGVPMATINLVTDTELHQAATVGFDPSVCLREKSLCSVVVDADAPVVVADARLDPRFRDNPFVTGRLGRIRFYAAHPLRTPSGVVIGTLCVFDVVPHALDTERAGALGALADRVVDVLELRLRTRQLATSLARQELIRIELEASNARLTALAGQVSHDLKSPLTSVSASLELLRDELVAGTPSDATIGLVDRALGGSLRMATMIDEVLGFARLGGSLQLDDVDLEPVVDEVLLDLAEVLAGVAVTIDPLPVVHGDRVQLGVVLQNLLSNAAKFRARVGCPQVRVSAVETRDGWRVEVADNGPGVPVAGRARLFEPLTRGDRPLEHAVEGSGIGLATCRRVIDAHAGRIGLADTPGGGTTAWFELPG